MTLILKTDTDLSGYDLPLLGNDPAQSNGSLFIYDVLDPASWPAQSGASASATLIDLSENDNATVGPDAGLAWAGSGGFTFTTGATTDKILLPTSSKLATDVEGFGVALWIKPTEAALTQRGIAGIGEPGTGFSNTQWAISRNLDSFSFYADGQIINPTYLFTVGTIYQLGITIEEDGSNYLKKSWVNGVLIGSATTAAPMATVASQARATIGIIESLMAATAGFTFYRCAADDLSTWDGAAFIAADYAAGVGRFS